MLKDHHRWLFKGSFEKNYEFGPFRISSCILMTISGLIFSRRGCSCLPTTIWSTATHCNTLQHTATHCNTLQHTATHCNTHTHYFTTIRNTATHCNTLQHTATHCNTLQHTATHCNTLQHTVTHYFTTTRNTAQKDIRTAYMNESCTDQVFQEQCVALCCSVLVMDGEGKISSLPE